MSRLNWWIVVRTPDGISAWEIGDPGPDTVTDLVMRARALTGFPHGDGWAMNPVRDWDLALTEEPHPDLGARLRPLDELTGLSAGVLEPYVAQAAQVAREQRLADASAVLAGLADEDLDELIARRQNRSAPAGGTDGNTGVPPVGRRG